MSTQHARPWPAIDVADLRYGLAFGSSVEEIADFLQRDVDDVRHQIEVQAHKTAQGSAYRFSTIPPAISHACRMVEPVTPIDPIMQQEAFDEGAHFVLREREGGVTQMKRGAFQ